MFKFRKISEISPSDEEVIIFGRVIGSNKKSFIIEDDSGKAEIFSEENVEEGKYARVFCTLKDGKLKAEILQYLNNFEANLYKKVKELYEKVKV